MPDIQQVTNKQLLIRCRTNKVRFIFLLQYSVPVLHASKTSVVCLKKTKRPLSQKVTCWMM